MNMECDRLKKGLSGILRVKNEAPFIERCVASCIDALDELVIVYNDCTDGSDVIIRGLQNRYPEKIRIYEYPHKIYAVGLSESEYEMAKALPDDSVHLLCNYYNFALEKVSYRHAIKIDADQIYFTEVLQQYRELCKEKVFHCPFSHRILGFFFQKYLSFFRRLSVESRTLWPLMPALGVRFFAQIYRNYAISRFLKGNACLSFSGINVLEQGLDTFVSLGHKNEVFNILPPFNGEGDHVIFKVSSATYYERYEMPYYNQLRSTSYSIIEHFVHPYRIMPVGFLWKHINAQRPEYTTKVELVKERFPTKYMLAKEFLEAKWKDILLVSDANMFTIYQRALFSFVYKAYGKELKKYLEC